MRHVPSSFRRLVMSTCLVAAFCLGESVAAELDPADMRTARPNLVLILADDLGYGNVSCYGSRKIETPHLDGLAAAGMKFTQFYSASGVCSPTRASIMTGRYPLRFGIDGHFPVRNLNEYLRTDVVTLPKLLRQAGYATVHVGKWHLGGMTKQLALERAAGSIRVPGPHQHGFDYYLSFREEHENLSRLKREARLYHDGAKYLIRNDQLVEPSDRHLTDYLVDEAVMLLEQRHKEEGPFFLNLCFYVPHFPLEPAPEPHLSKYKGRAKGNDLLYRSMVSHMDACVGRVVGKLKALGIFDNTLLIFTSDNGPRFPGSPGPWNGGKADLHEGGIRVPMLAVWPAHIPAGSVSDALAHTNDILPTFCAVAGATVPEDLEIDGLNLLPHLTENKPIADRGTVFWQMRPYSYSYQPGPKPKPHATEVARRGRWKLMARGGKPLGLFDLEADPGETVNLLGEHPEITRQLTEELASWLAEPRRSSK